MSIKKIIFILICLVSFGCTQDSSKMNIKNLTSTKWDMGQDHYYEYLIFEKDGTFKGKDFELGGTYNGKYFIQNGELHTYVSHDVHTNYPNSMINGYKAKYIFVGSGLKKISSKLGTRDEIIFYLKDNPSYYPTEMDIYDRFLDRTMNE